MKTNDEQVVKQVLGLQERVSEIKQKIARAKGLYDEALRQLKQYGPSSIAEGKEMLRSLRKAQDKAVRRLERQVSKLNRQVDEVERSLR